MQRICNVVMTLGNIWVNVHLPLITEFITHLFMQNYATLFWSP